MIEITNQEIFGKTIAQALTKIEGNSSLKTYTKLRWINAVAKAAVQIEDNGTFMDYQENDTLLIWSSKSNEIYEANGVCQCESFKRGNPCWHRAAKQLVKHYQAAEAAEDAAVLAEALSDREAFYYFHELWADGAAVKLSDCECVWNWDDKFVEVYCPMHEEEAAANAEAERAYYEQLDEATNEAREIETFVTSVKNDIHSYSKAPYLKGSSDKPTLKIGNIRI